MSFRIRRRRFGQLAIASAAASAITNFAGKSVAQQPPVIYGVRLGTTSTTSTTPQALIANIANNTPATVLISSDLGTGNQLSVSNIAATVVDNVSTPIETAAKALSIQSPPRITGFTATSDGTLIIATVTDSQQGDVNQITFTNTTASKSQRSVKVSGFQKSNSTLESLLSTRDNQLLSVISLSGGTPPFDLATIDSNSGRVTSGASLGLPDIQGYQRYSNLAQSPDGTIYATNLTSEGNTTLVQLDLVNKLILTGRGRINKLVQLSFNQKPVENDLQSLAFSASGELYALADLNRSGTNSLYSVDVKSGVLKLVRQFNVDKIAFPR